MRILFTLFCSLLLTGTTLAQDYQETEVTNGGTITGTVALEGDAPAPLRLLITKDAEVCGLGYRERIEYDVNGAGALRGVVVYLEEVATGKPWSAAPAGTFINQEVCAFTPNIQVMKRGTEIDIINSDSTLHNIHGYELIGRARRSLFNISQPDLGPVPQMMHPSRGNQVSLECDSHDFMQGWIFVSDHPYSMVVDENGAFELTDVPEGTYRLSVWHPKLGVQTQDVTVSNSSTEESNFVFSID